MSTRWTWALVAVGLWVASCHKPKPSPDFQQAHAKFTAVFAEQLEDAYGDPRMDEILTQLRQVPRGSSDAPAAQELIARIEQGRARLRAERAQRTPAPPESSPSEPSAPSFALPPSESGERDAGNGWPHIGMSRAEFEKELGSCFRSGQTVYLNGKDPAESRTMIQLTDCRQKLPNFEDRMVLIRGDSVVAVVERSQLTVTQEAEGSVPGGGRLDGGR